MESRKKGFEWLNLSVITILMLLLSLLLVDLEFATLTYKYQVSALDFVDEDINDELFKTHRAEYLLYQKHAA